MSQYVYLVTLGLFFGTILLVFGMRYISEVLQARAHFLNDSAYRCIAETAAIAQSETAAALSSIQTMLVEVKTRLAAVEQILKAVE